MRNQYLVKTACRSSSSTLRPEHWTGISVKQIERVGLLAVALAATVVLATGCSSTGVGFDARLMNPVPNKQLTTNSEEDSWYPRSRGPALSDFGSLGGA
jgi:hypothetical protein